MSTIIRVEKKDGTTQDWELHKVVNSLAACGVPASETENIGPLIESWVTRNTQNQTIKSEKIRAKVVELLKVIYPQAASAYESYKK